MEAITANYIEHTDQWTVTVTTTDNELTAQASGIVAAREQAEQLIESLKSTTGETAVVHLLNGSALEFTTEYMTARLSRSAAAEPDATDAATVPQQSGSASTQQEPVAAESPAAADTGATASAATSTTDAETTAGNTHDVESTAKEADSAQQFAQQ